MNLSALVQVMLGLGMVGVASAQPAAPAPEAAPEGLMANPVSDMARPTLPPLSVAEEVVAGAVRETFRAGFERHNIKAYFAGFSADAVWVRGRRPVAEGHDVRFERARMRALKGLRWRRATTGQERAYFDRMQVQLKGEEATLEFETVRAFFGGQDRTGWRCVVRRVGTRWVISKARSWPLQVNFGGENIPLDDGRWLDLDAEVEQLGAEESFSAHIGAMARAYQYKAAYALAKAKTEAPGATMEQWSTRANFALALGLLGDARAAVKAAQRIDSSYRGPALLR